LGKVQKIGGLSSFEEMLAALAGQAIATQQGPNEKYAAKLRDFAEFAPVIVSAGRPSHFVAIPT
jgi:hypothetical protein